MFRQAISAFSIETKYIREGFPQRNLVKKFLITRWSPIYEFSKSIRNFLANIFFKMYEETFVGRSYIYL